jgi:hypothetical protein
MAYTCKKNTNHPVLGTHTTVDYLVAGGFWNGLRVPSCWAQNTQEVNIN